MYNKVKDIVLYEVYVMRQGIASEFLRNFGFNIIFDVSSFIKISISNVIRESVKSRASST